MARLKINILLFHKGVIYTVSKIEFAAINENFPVPGKDNDTQVFRDNFDTIKTSLRVAKEEITKLEENTAGLKLNAVVDGSDFQGNVISNAVMRNNRDKLVEMGIRSVPTSIEYESGSYHRIRFDTNTTLDFVGFPDETLSAAGVGRVTLEIYNNGSEPHTITLDSSYGVKYKKSNWKWNGDFFVVESATDPLVFEAWRYNNQTIFIYFKGQFV